MRRDARLTGRALADALGWPASKVSKLENGRQSPSDDDIHAWTRATGAEAAEADLLASLHTLQSQHAEWSRLLRYGMRHHQDELAELGARTRRFRVFEAATISGLLQTPDYARACLAQGPGVLNLPNDVEAAVQGRMRRQEALYRADKRFHFVLTEAALRYRRCPPEAMLAQLDRLVILAALPTVRLGVVGFDAQFVIGPWHGFWIYDDDRVKVETFSAGLTLAQAPEVELYGRVFDQLAAAASYGRDARKIITRVADDLAAGLPDADDGG